MVKVKHNNNFVHMRWNITVSETNGFHPLPHSSNIMEKDGSLDKESKGWEEGGR